MQQRLLFGGQIEVPTAAPEQHVRPEQRHRHQAAAEGGCLSGQHQPPRGGKAHSHHHEQRRQDAARPAIVEADDREAPGPQFVGNDRRDQEAADHEEHIHADITPAEQSEARVEQDHRQHRQRTQTIDFGPVHHVRGGLHRLCVNSVGRPGMRRID